MEKGLLEVHGDVDVDVDVFGDDVGGWKWKRVKKKQDFMESISTSHRFYPS